MEAERPGRAKAAPLLSGGKLGDVGERDRPDMAPAFVLHLQSVSVEEPALGGAAGNAAGGDDLPGVAIGLVPGGLGVGQARAPPVFEPAPAVVQMEKEMGHEGRTAQGLNRLQKLRVNVSFSIIFC